MRFRPGVQFAFLVAISLVLGWRALAECSELAARNEAYTHMLLILPLFVGMACLTQMRQGSVPRPAAVPGSTVLAAGLVLGAVAWLATGWPADVRLATSMLALVTWWIGGVVFCFGTHTSRSLLFPLCFLYWLVPIPDAGLEWIVQLLQKESALATRVFFTLVGVPVTQDGTLLSLPTLDIEVAPECSSIRSSMVLVVTTMVLGHLFLRSWWRKSLLILAAIPLAAAKNGLRIFTIAQLGLYDPKYFDGELHHRGGIVFFGVAVVTTILFLWVLRRTEHRTEQILRPL